MASSFLRCRLCALVLVPPTLRASESPSQAMKAVPGPRPWAVEFLSVLEMTQHIDLCKGGVRDNSAMFCYPTLELLHSKPGWQPVTCLQCLRPLQTGATQEQGAHATGVRHPQLFVVKASFLCRIQLISDMNRIEGLTVQQSCQPHNL